MSVQKASVWDLASFSDYLVRGLVKCELSAYSSWCWKFGFAFWHHKPFCFWARAAPPLSFFPHVCWTLLELSPSWWYLTVTDKRRDEENDLFKEGDRGTILSHPFLYLSAAGCIYLCGIAVMPFALECAHVSLLSSLSQHMSVSEKGQKGEMCEMRENDSSTCTCCQLNVSKCLSLSYCSFLAFPSLKYPPYENWTIF